MKNGLEILLGAAFIVTGLVGFGGFAVGNVDGHRKGLKEGCKKTKTWYEDKIKVEIVPNVYSHGIYEGYVIAKWGGTLEEVEEKVRNYSYNPEMGMMLDYRSY